MLNFSNIFCNHYADIIEKRSDDTWFTKETALKENRKNLELCQKNGCHYILIDTNYHFDVERGIFE